MLTVEEALVLVSEHARPLAPRHCPLLESLGCVLAEDIEADDDQPPFDKALVDGYAVNAADLGGNGRLQVGETIFAGQTPSRPLARGEAAVIMTGAPLPPGADAVIMHEHTKSVEGQVLADELTVQPGTNRLERGTIYKTGDVVLKRGTRLSPACLGLLASVGKPQVLVVPRPKVAIVSTGDELVEPDRIPGPCQIRNSNSVMLAAQVMAHGAVVEVLPIAPDEPVELERILKQGLDFDALLISGGVSAGQRDLVPAVLHELGVERVFHKVRLKPGKPLWFGIGPRRGDRGGTCVFGLPGNPVSGLVGFLLFVRRALDILAGNRLSAHSPIDARLGAAFVHRGDRPTYYPARWLATPAEGASQGVIEPLTWAGSGDLLGVARSDGLAIFPAGDRAFEAGEIVRFLPLC
jgi:molybdopterin molybdotransferase